MKIDGSIGSLVQGVSQQAPGERRLGQHTQQVNLIADPVRGLSRRNGSVQLKFTDLALGVAAATENVLDSASWRSFDYTSEGRDLTVLYRTATKYSGSNLPTVVVYDHTNNQFLTVVRPGVDVGLDALDAGGASAITAVGKYVFIAGNTITPSITNTDAWGDSTNQQRTVAWVRGGAYSRTYSATVTKADNTQVTFSYTTPTSSFPGTPQPRKRFCIPTASKLEHT